MPLSLLPDLLLLGACVGICAVLEGEQVQHLLTKVGSAANLADAGSSRAGSTSGSRSSATGARGGRRSARARLRAMLRPTRRNLAGSLVVATCALYAINVVFLGLGVKNFPEATRGSVTCLRTDTARYRACSLPERGESRGSGCSHRLSCRRDDDPVRETGEEDPHNRIEWNDRIEQ